jgi:Tol biopolymer transport system component
VRGGIGVIPVNGGEVRYLTDSGIDPHWSPDGRTLVYRSGGLNAVREPASWDGTLMLVDLDGSPPHSLTRAGSPRGGHNFPRWLPDGRHVVFTAPRETSSNSPWIVDVRTGETHAAPAPIPFMQFPTLDANGRYLYFVGSGPEELIGLWRARLDRNWNPRNPESLMPTSGALLRDLAVNPDSSRIAYSQEFGQSSIWSVALGPDGRADGEPKPLIQDHSFRNTGPSFSADGSRIAYSSVRQGGNWTIMMANADGTSATPVTTTERANSVPAWLANDLTLGFQAYRKGEGGYWMATPQGPLKRLDLKIDLRRADNIQVSRDGTHVAAHIRTPSGAKIVLEDLSKGTIRDLTSADRNISFPCWSPDGRWIAAQERVQGRSTVVIISVDTGDVQTLVDEPGHSWARDWSSDGDRIAFAGLRDGLWNLYWVSRSTRHVEQLTHFKSQSAFVRYPAWSPKNNQVAFEYNELAANIYVADLR